MPAASRFSSRLSARPVPYGSLRTRMLTRWFPSPAMTFASACACSASGGAVRKYRPLSCQQVNSSEVLAGENCTTPAPVTLSMTSLVTPDAAAPTMAWVPLPSWRSTVWFAMSVVSSPESPRTWVTCWPSTPPFSLISTTARSTPANSGRPRKARLPVSGSSDPTFSGSVVGLPLGCAWGTSHSSAASPGWGPRRAWCRLHHPRHTPPAPARPPRRGPPRGAVWAAPCTSPSSSRPWRCRTFRTRPLDRGETSAAGQGRWVVVTKT